ncbi:hypothetical protein MYX82_05575 [Acidobacteria bacterium AH-259-D05]|nr:hypothetical protein [Acidobacteria bacterium AH-259-D05]
MRFYLADLQGGTLDRFALRNKSVVELKHLQSEIETSITHVQADAAKLDDILGEIGRQVESDLGLPRGLERLVRYKFLPTRKDKYDVWVKKRLLSEIKLKFKVTTPSRAEKIIQQAASKCKTIQAVRKKMNEIIDQTDDPEEQKLIKRVFKQRIDDLMEEL